MTSLLLSVTELGFVTEARDFSIAEKANLFTIMNASDIVMKLAQGMIADLQVIKKTFKYPMKFLYRFNAVGMAVTMIGAGLVDSLPELATVAAIATFFNANVMINFSQILRCDVFSCEGEGAAQQVHLCLHPSICTFVLKLNFSLFGPYLTA